MMASGIISWFALCILVWNEVNLLQSVYPCDTNKDCEDILFGVLPHCCGGEWTIFPVTRRSCQRGDCLNHYCEIESHCGDPKYCCRSNKCTVHGCSNCKYDSDCSASGHVCCKKSFPTDQTLCAEKCHGLDCNNDDDCATNSRECCRDGKCVGGLSSLSCLVNCKANSDCHSGQYCCREKNVWIVQDGCSETCIGEECDSDTDCGPPNECCIAGKCTKNGCPKCSTDSDCTYCCLSGKCVNRSVCATKEPPMTSTKKPPVPSPTKESSNSMLMVAIIAVVVVLLIAASAIVFWRCKVKRRNNTSQVNGAQNTCVHDPTLQQGTVFTLQIPKFSSHIPRNEDYGYTIPNVPNAADQIYDSPYGEVRGIRRPASGQTPTSFPDDPPPYSSIH